MKKVKVRIYKDPSGQGGYIDPKREYLKKAAYGMQVGGSYLDIQQSIIDQLKETDDVESIIDDLMNQYGLSYYDAADQINDVVDTVVKNEVKAEEEELVPEPEVKKPPLYALGETSEDVEGAGWEDDETEEDDLSLGRQGGSMGKKKFVKTIVRGLRKAAEGMQQDVSNSASITDMSVGGRESKINDFRRAIKDLGNEYCAKEIYKSTKNLADQTSALPPIAPNDIAAYGMEVKQDEEDPGHHLGVYGDMVGNIFKQPYNQVQGTAFQNIPKAKRGMEQRQMNRAAKDFRNMFGDVAAGYSGVPGMPNYLQVISPNIIQNPQGTSQTTQDQSGPLIDLSFKKGPWWTGKREWTAKGVPMGMFGAPGGRSTGYSSSWNTARTYPGEIIRDKVRTFNSAADPSKVGVTPKATDQNKQAALAAFTTDKPVTNAQGVPLTSDGSNMMWGQQGLPAEKPQVMREFAEEQVDPLTGLYTPASSTSLIPSSTDSEIEFDNTGQSNNMLYNENTRMNEADISAMVGLFGNGNPDDLREDLLKSGYTLAEFTEAKRRYLESKGAGLNNNPELNSTAATVEENKAFGGAINNVQPDQYGNLQRFVYGGDELPISPIVAYDNNDIQSKNVDDPFQYRQGGLYRFAGPDNSQVTTGTTTQPGATSPTWKDLNEADYSAKLAEEKKKWETDYAKKQQQTQTQTRTQTQGGYYPTAGTPLQQIKAMFSPIKKDFTWARQTDFPRTVDGQIYQPGAGYVQGQPGTTAGYMPSEIKYEKGPWWSGKKTMTVKNSWFDPTKPITGTNQPGSFANGQGPVADPNAKGVVTTNTPQNNTGATSNTQINPATGTSFTPEESIGWKQKLQNKRYDKFMEPYRNADKENDNPPTSMKTLSNEPNLPDRLESASGEELAKLQADPTTRPSDPNAYVQGEYGDVMTDINELVPEAQAEYDEFLKTDPTKEEIATKMDELLAKRNAQIDRNTANENSQQANVANAASYSRNPMMMGSNNPNAQTQTSARGQLSTPPTEPNSPQPSGAIPAAGQPEVNAPQSVNAPAPATTLQSFTGTSNQDNFNSANLPDRAQQILAGRSGNIDNNQSYAGSQGPRPSENISQLVANNPRYQMPVGAQQEIPNNPQTPGVQNFAQYTDAFEGAPSNDSMNLYGTMNGMSEGSMRNKEIQAKSVWNAAQAKLAEQKRQAQVQAQQQQQQGNFANGMSNSGVQDIASRVQNPKDLGNRELVAAGKVYKMWEQMPAADKKKAGGFDKWANANGYGNLVNKQYGGTPEYMAYGGYMPTFDPGGQFSGTGPSDPNSNSQRGGMGQGLTGPCTEFEVQDPNSPCYDPNYKPGVLETPKDFTTKYDIETARTFDPDAALNLKKAGAYGIEKGAAINENIYNQTYLNNNTTSDNRMASNQKDFSGGYSGLNQRIMSKGQGAGSTGFNRVVGDAAFVKKGGELNFKEGGVYDLTQEQIGKILAAGGQIKFIN